jgi:hypothetical protein
MLAYVFWHWKRATIPALEYEARQRAFHAALAGAPPAGFERSSCARLTGAPWAADGAEAYEDWYLVHDFAALGVLKDAAISASRQAPHDAAAAAALSGTAGVYALQAGAPLSAPTLAHWFGKPDGMSYRELLAELTPLVQQAGAALWLRQLVLGPPRELCILAPARLELPPAFAVLELELAPVWSGS